MTQPLRVARPVDAVVERLRQDVLSGVYPAGSHLPPERQLSERLGVSRLTLRAGLARLEAEGLVRARQGDGVRVLELAEHATLGVLAHLDLSARPELMRSFLELRRAIAVEAVALACARARDEAVDGLEQLARAQEQETDDARYARRDVEFARALLEASESFAALLLFNALAPVYEAHPRLGRALIADRARSLAGYGAVIALLRARDAAGARTALREALEHADAEVLAALSPRRRAKRGGA
jgi:GntR family transcriptional repressor for pyruvate dehydrogenase complex